MNKKAIPVFLIAILIFISGSCKSDYHFAPTILVSAEYLLNSKNKIEKGDTTLTIAFENLIKDADKALKDDPYTVTKKEKLPPSGNRNDYASYSRYWWPDPNKADGLPYIRRDGETNPDSQNLKESDRPRIGAFGENTEALGLAYYITKNPKYAKKAAEFLRVWFLDEATRMNPNLNHAQCRPGHNKGTKSGVLDGRLMIRALEGSLLISGSNELSKTETKGLKAWAYEYFVWLSTNKMALQEAASKNNHGTYYDAQVMYFALYSENYEAAKKIALQFIRKRVFTQIQEDGSMPKEIARTRPLFYSIFNLHAMFLVAHLAEQVNVDIWNGNEKRSRLQIALDYLVPYADPKNRWPQPTTGEVNSLDMLAILQMADRAYPDENYMQFAEKLPQESRKNRRENLAFPLMR